MRLIVEQLHYAAWTDWCPLIGFALSFSVFDACLWRAFRVPENQLEQMANLPLEETSFTPSQSEESRHAKGQ